MAEKQEKVATVKTIVQTNVSDAETKKMQDTTDMIHGEIDAVFVKYGIKSRCRIIAFDYEGHLAAKLQGSKRDMLLTLLQIGESIG